MSKLTSCQPQVFQVFWCTFVGNGGKDFQHAVSLRSKVMMKIAQGSLCRPLLIIDSMHRA